MYEPEKILVQNAGIDPGVAALLQNANKGNMDPAALIEAQVEAPIITNTIDNSKEINDLKNDVADIRKMIEDAKKMFMGGFPKPPMPPMPNVPAPQMK